MTARLSAPRVLIRTALFLSGAVLLAWMGWSARDEFIAVVRGASAPYLLAAVGLGVFYTMAQGRLLAYLFAKHGTPEPAGMVVAAFLVSQPGKYVPGKVWAAVMQSLVLGTSPSPGAIAISNVELALIGVLHMAALGLMCLWLSYPIVAATTVLAGILVATLLIMLPPAAYGLILPTALKRWLRLNVTEGVALPMRAASAIVVSAMLMVLNLLASYCVLLAVGDAIPQTQHWAVLAVFYLGFAASVLALPVPAGIGLREAAIVGLGLVLAPQVDGALLVSIALLSRCWQLGIDAACLVAGGVYLTVVRRAQNSH